MAAELAGIRGEWVLVRRFPRLEGPLGVSVIPSTPTASCGFPPRADTLALYVIRYALSRLTDRSDESERPRCPPGTAPHGACMVYGVLYGPVLLRM